MMGRHSAIETAQLTVRVPRGQQAYWDMMREQRQFTSRSISDQTNARRDTVAEYMRRLERAGFIQPLDRTGRRGQAVTYELVIDQPDAPVVRRDGTITQRQGMGTEQMWRSMRMLDQFDAKDLAHAASTDDVQVQLDSAKDYIKRLYAAGYLLRLRQPPKGGRTGLGIYKLRAGMYTGPLAPQIMRIKAVWDANLNQLMEQEGGAS